MDRYDIIRGMIPTDSKVLDYGCGNGHFTRLLNSDGIETTGIDLDTAITIDHFDDDTFDVVISICVLEHTVNPGIYIENVRRVLKSDGLFIVCIPIIVNVNSIISQLLFNKKLVKSFKNISHSHVIGWDASTFTCLMNRMGFIYADHVLQGGSAIGKLHIPLLGLRYTMIFKYRMGEKTV